jgi:hypothetical protein
MKLYAQHGYAPSDKLNRAIEENFIDGVIFSPRYLTLHSTKQISQELRRIDDEIDILVDPEFYATRYVGNPNAQLRYLEEWPHFISHRRNELLVGTDVIDQMLRNSYELQTEIGCTHIIAPNIYIASSFDSIEAAIAISFINRTKQIANDLGISVPVYATVAVYRDALVDRQNFLNFLNAITAMDISPDGIYSLIGAGPTDERVGTIRSEILSRDVIAGWMLLNYSLSLNGMDVVNGFSDILTPFLGAAGGYSGATGWWSNLQVFSMGRYIRSSAGGQLPLVKYLSKKLLNRINVNEREAFARVKPDIMNGLSTDDLYEGRQPDRTEEALQHWQALTSMIEDIISQNLGESLERLRNCITSAESCYNELLAFGFSENIEANIEYLHSLRESISAFEQLAEL